MDDVISLGVGEPDFDTPRADRRGGRRDRCARAGPTTRSNYGTLELRRALADAPRAAATASRYDPATRDPRHGRRVRGGRPRAARRPATRATRSSSTSRRTSPTCRPSCSPAASPVTSRPASRTTSRSTRRRSRRRSRRGPRRCSWATRATRPARSCRRRRPGRARRDRRAPRPARLSDEIYDRLVYGDVPPPGDQRAAGHARADDPDGRLLEGLRDDRLAGRLRRARRRRSSRASSRSTSTGSCRRRRPPRTPRSWRSSSGRAGRRADGRRVRPPPADVRRRAQRASACATFEPRGAFYAFPRISSTGLTSEQFTERLLFEEHVAVVPGQRVRAVGRGPRADVLRDHRTRSSRRRSCGSSGSSERVGVTGAHDADRRAPARRRGTRRSSASRSTVQLRTASKMFCGCSTDYDGAPPNSHVCPVCLGLPGRAAGDQPAGRRARPGDRRWRSRRPSPRRPAGTARTTSTRTCPKGYQISQYDLPLASRGRLTFDTSDGPFTVGDHARPPRGGHGQAHPRDRRRRPAASASSTSTGPARR